MDFEASDWSKYKECSDQKTYLAKVDGSAQNIGVDPFPDPVGHFGTPGRPVWMFEVLIKRIMESLKLLNDSRTEGPITVSFRK